MKLGILLILFSVIGLNAGASSGQWERQNLENAEMLAFYLEKEESDADDVQILDSYMQDGVAYVTVGPEWGGRAARLYHCWKITFGEGYEIIGTDRDLGRACRQL